MVISDFVKNFEDNDPYTIYISLYEDKDRIDGYYIGDEKLINLYGDRNILDFNSFQDSNFIITVILEKKSVQMEVKDDKRREEPNREGKKIIRKRQSRKTTTTDLN